MSNTEKAARVIYDALSGQYGDFRLPTDAAEALADAGLLMADLPKPWLHRPYDSFVWATTEPVVAARDRTVVELGSYEWIPDEARDLALALLAAADYARNTQPRAT